MGRKERKEDKFPFKIWHFKMAERAVEPWRVLPLCQIPARAAHWTSGLSQLNQNVRTQKPHHKLCLLKSRYIILLVLLSIGLLQSRACLCMANGGMPSLFSFRENLYQPPVLNILNNALCHSFSTSFLVFLLVLKKPLTYS